MQLYRVLFSEQCKYHPINIVINFILWSLKYLPILCMTYFKIPAHSLYDLAAQTTNKNEVCSYSLIAEATTS